MKKLYITRSLSGMVISDSAFKLTGKVTRINNGVNKSNLLATQHRARKINQARFELSSEAAANREQVFVIPSDDQNELFMNSKAVELSHNIINYLWRRVDGARFRLNSLLSNN